jgi:hypothetical protein
MASAEGKIAEVQDDRAACRRGRDDTRRWPSPRMEHSWTGAVATAGNRWQLEGRTFLAALQQPAQQLAAWRLRTIAFRASSAKKTTGAQTTSGNHHQIGTGA